MIKLRGIKHNWHIFLLAGLFLFHLVNNIVYATIDTRPPAWDESWHSSISLSYYNAITGNGESSLEKVSLMLHERSTRYPHLFHISSLPLYLLFGFNEDIAVMTNMLYFLVLIIFTYLLGKELYNRKVGVFASFLVSFYPIAYGLSRHYLIDFSLMGLSAAFLYYLIMLKTKVCMKNVAGLAIAVILGSLIKQTFLIFVFAPLIYVIILKFYEKYKSSKKRASLLIAFFSSLLIIGIMFLCYLKQSSGFYLIEIIKSQLAVSDLSRLFEAILYMPNVQMSPILFVLFLSSLTRWRYIKEKTVFLLSIVVPLVALSMANFLSDGRYYMPILVPIAIISMAGVFSIKHKKIIPILLAFILIFSLFQYFDFTYSQGYHAIKVGKLELYTNRVYIIDGVRRENWKIEEILDLIKNSTKKEQTKIGIVANIQRFNVHNFAFYAYKHNYNFLVISPQNLGETEYIITKTGHIADSNGPDYSWALEELKKKGDSFIKLGEFDLPDNSKASIYHHIREDTR